MALKFAKKPRKAKLCVRVHPHVDRQLKLIKAQTDKPVCVLIEEAVARHYGITLPPVVPEPT